MSSVTSVQFCPRCGSRKIREANLVPLTDPAMKAGFFGWECLECGYVGKDFFVVDEVEYKKIRDAKGGKPGRDKSQEAD